MMNQSEITRAEIVRGWIYLTLTIILEVTATLALKASEGFTRPLPSIVSISAYIATVVVLALVLKVIPASIAYVIWTGAGTAGVALLGMVIFNDVLTPVAWLGVVFVILGVIMINAKIPNTPTPEASASNAPEERPE